MRSNRTEGTIYFLFTRKESKTKKSEVSRQNDVLPWSGAFLKKSFAKNRFTGKESKTVEKRDVAAKRCFALVGRFFEKKFCKKLFYWKRK